MTRIVTNAALVMLLLLPGTNMEAQTAEQCRSGAYWDVNDPKIRGADELVARCVDLGHQLAGPFSYSDLSAAPSTTNPLLLTGELGSADPKNLSRGCTTRLIADRICLLHAKLFEARSGEGRCPLKRILQPDRRDLMDAAFRSFGVGAGICTSFQTWSLPHEVIVRDATSGDLGGLSISDEKVFSKSIQVSVSTIDRAFFDNYVVLGDLVIDDSSVGYVSLEGTIVTGDLKIRNSSIGFLSADKLWVAGDLIYEGNSQNIFLLSGPVTVGNDFIFLRNQAIFDNGDKPSIRGDLAALGDVNIDLDSACPDKECIEMHREFKDRTESQSRRVRDRN